MTRPVPACVFAASSKMTWLRCAFQAWIRTVFVGATHDQVATSNADAHAACRVADLEQDLQVWRNRRQPRDVLSKHILSKLGFRSRSQVAAWVVETTH
jgi:hypothetical protein